MFAENAPLGDEFVKSNVAPLLNLYYKKCSTQKLAIGEAALDCSLVPLLGHQVQYGD